MRLLAFRSAGVVILLFVCQLGAPRLFAQNLYSLQRFRTTANVFGFKVRTGTAVGQETFYAPLHSHFIILDKPQGKYVVRFTKRGAIPTTPSALVVGGTVARVDLSNEKPITADATDYEIDESSMSSYDYEFYSGLVPGGMVVPVKWQHDGVLTSGSTIGLSAGFKQRWFGFPLTALVAAGLANIPTQNVNSTTPTNKSGYTYGFGLVTDVYDVFQIGLVFGRDHLGGSDGAAYPYEDKWWHSFEIGFAFSK